MHFLLSHCLTNLSFRHFYINFQVRKSYNFKLENLIKMCLSDERFSKAATVIGDDTDARCITMNCNDLP